MKEAFTSGRYIYNIHCTAKLSCIIGLPCTCSYRLVGVTCNCFIESLGTRLRPDHNVVEVDTNLLHSPLHQESTASKCFGRYLSRLRRITGGFFCVLHDADRALVLFAGCCDCCCISYNFWNSVTCCFCMKMATCVKKHSTQVGRSVINLVKVLCWYLVVQVPLHLFLFWESQHILLARILSTSFLGSAGSLWPIAIGTMQGFVFIEKQVQVKFFQISPLVIQYSHLWWRRHYALLSTEARHLAQLHMP